MLLSVQILSHPEARELHGYDAIVVLTLLINYRKYEVRGSLTQLPCFHGSYVVVVLGIHSYVCVHVCLLMDSIFIWVVV